jgi:CBS domain-containing protein/anti-sigma regulatory factor (Ser/Thr protein kinase)
MANSPSDNSRRFQNKVITDELAGNITRVEELAYILQIEDVMTRDIKTLTPDNTMLDLLEVLKQYHVSGVPIIDDSTKELVGLVSTEDLIKCLANDDAKAPIKSYMATDLITVKTYDFLTEALKKFSRTKVGRLPVLDKEEKLVGIITKGDITNGILRALEKEYQEEEVRRYRASHLFEDIESDRSSLILRYNIAHYDFTSGGKASSNIKRALLRLGANAQLARRVGIAIYEAEMNLIIHTSNGGSIHVEIEPTQISVYVWDNGPGIEDVELALKPGYSTATEEVRELGFGAGMGLVNISRCVDEMDLQSEWGTGTHLTLKIYLKGEDIFGEGYQKRQGEDNES